MAEKNNEIRLFKVVKELNISSDRLVEFLQKSGEKNVVDDLNYKLSQTQHEILLKQFAPEKLPKTKAEETSLSKSNDAPSHGENENTANPTVLKPEVMQKHKVLGKIDLDALRTKKKPETLANKEGALNLPETENPLEKPKVEPPVEAITPPKTEVEIPISKENIPSTPIIDKQIIDKKSVEAPANDLPKEEKPIQTHFPKREKIVLPTDKLPITKIELPIKKVDKPILREEKKIETPIEEVSKITPQPKIEESLVAKVDVPLIETEKPKTEKSFPPKEEKPFVPKVEKKVEPITEKKPTEISTEILPEIGVEHSVDENSEDIDVIRANAPTLTGLKVLGKIELESRKKKGVKDNKKREKPKDKKDIVKGKEPIGGAGEVKDKVRTWDKDKVAADAKVGAGTAVPKDGVKDDDSEEAKRKRKRKRKRKKTGTETPTTTAPVPTPNPATPPRVITVIHASKLAEDRKAAKGKEKVVDKDVHSSMRKTLDVMSRGAGRVRQRARRTKRDEAQRRKEEQDQFDSDESRILRITEFVTANELAELLDVSVTTVISKCFQLGMMVSINMRLDAELITLIADEFDYDVEFVDVREEELEEEQDAVDDENLVKRDPVITVMGHVDHGKTTLLDFLRKANVAGGEAGGITQHIGAYQVKLKTGDAVTFLDTPGHEAFTAMRARGTKVTDVAIIVVAADDAVMPTTREAISHAQAGNVPMVFAINKMDKAGADPERIRGQLAEMNLLVEQWGGKIMCQEIAAKFGTNVDDLLEKVILESEILDLKANPKRHANGSVIESRVDKGRGNVVTMLVQNGTLRVGDTLVAGIHYGKVRALLNQNGVIVKEAGPSMPVQVLGMSGLPQAGDKFQVYREDSKAKEISRKRSELYREQQLRQTKRITLEEIGRRKLLGNFKELNLIVKGDVDGSVEALSGALLKLSIDEVAVNIVLKGTGQISESDVLLASASDALIIAFNVRPGVKARELADKEGVTIRAYSIIYNAIEDITAALEGMLSPEVKEEIMANVEVRQVFNISKVGNIAGCYVASGKITKTDNVRVIRDGIVLSEAKIQTLKRYKDDVKDVPGGYECGLQIQGFSDLQAGDILECYRVTELKRRL